MLTERELRLRVRDALQVVTPPAPWLASAINDSLAKERRRSWRYWSPRRLQMDQRFVAVFLLIVLALAAVAAFLASHNSPTRPLPASPSSSSTGTCSAGTRLHMVNATVGWQGDPDRTDWYGGPLRTTDGGLHWRSLSVPAQPGNVTKTGSTSCFLDADHAWVSLNTESGPLVIYRTADGGRTWQSSVPVPGGGRSLFVRLEFIDDQHGWLLNDTGPDISPNSRTIYSTTDGGLHWNQVAKATIGDVSTLGTLALGCAESGMTFIGVDTGWLTWDCRRSVTFPGQGPLVAVTRDGGRSWTRVALPAYASSGQSACNALPPIFTQAHGVLPVTCLGTGHNAIFRTNDSGRSWNFLLPPADSELTIVDFIDADTGWALSHVQSCDLTIQPGSSDLYKTTNGGRDWVLVKRGLFSDQAVYAFQFIDKSNAFAYYDCGKATLGKTTDGGLTWSVVNPNV